MISKILKRLRKPLSLDFINDILRSKGIATNPRGENDLAFKLYDMTWNLYYENGRIGVRNTFNIGNDIDMDSLLKAANQLNKDRWIVKAFIDTYTSQENESESQTNESISVLTFTFEIFCYSKSDFSKIYEFAIYAMTDAIEYHRKCYAEQLDKKKSQKAAAPIGFQTGPNDTTETNVFKENHKRTKVGFV